MANLNGRIPKQAARKLIEDFKLSQIVIVARTQCGSQICLTDGLTSRDQENAAVAGEVWEQIMQLGSKSCRENLMQVLGRLSREKK